MVVERLMETHWDADGFDVLEHGCFRFIDVFIALKFGPLMLE